MSALLDAAAAFAGAGCSVIPASADGSKAPAGKWQQYQVQRPGADQIRAWLGNGTYDGFGLVCGAVSGGLEMLELEGRAVTAGMLTAYRDLLADHDLGPLWEKITSGYTEVTPSGGVHILYRVDGTPRGNTKLAHRPATAAELAKNPQDKLKVLIETRGEGGFTIVAPSGGRTHPTGRPWQLARGGPASIAVITEDERNALYAIASLLDEAPPPPPPAQRGEAGGGGRPGDDFAARATWEEILAPHGWTPGRSPGRGARGWRRPGKDGPGISATTRDDGGLFVFSTSTPFEEEVAYSKFGAYAVLNHGGDYSAAAAQLRRDGYGEPLEHDDEDIGSLIATGQAAAATGGQLAGPRVVSLADVQAERVDWLWDGYLPLGKVVVLDGDPGVGKSTVSLDIAARTSTGSPMPDGSAGVKGTVLVLSAEDGLADTIRPRLDAAGADPARVIAITEMTYATQDGEQSRPVTIPGDLAAIEQIIAGHDVRLVVVDVLMAYLSGDVNAHRDQDVRRALHVLSSLAERTSCCVIVLRHLNKSGGGNAIYRGGGSIGIIGAARAGFICGRDPDDETGQLRVFANIKMNIAPEPPALGYRLIPDELHGCGRIEWLGTSDYRASDILAQSGNSDENTGRNGANEWLRELLGDGPVKATEVYKAADAAGFSKDQAKRAKKKVGVLAAKAGMDGPWYWALAIHEGDLNDLPEESAKGAKSADPGGMHPSPPSVLPSEKAEPTGAVCAGCGEPMTVIEPGQRYHPMCQPGETS